MKDPRLARRYARALFAVTEEHGVSDRVAGEFRQFIAILDENPNLRAFLGTPNVTAAEKEKVLRSVLDGLVDRSLEEFLILLRDKNRFALVHETEAEYRKLLDAARHVIEARVTTAVPLTAEERKQVQAALEKRTGFTIELADEVDPSVIGGAVVVLGSQIIDDTIRHHLQVLRERLAEIPVHMTAERVSA
jgi:F-type H+-transporting ATPase subunit delta